jgi:hypothetical protein
MLDNRIFSSKGPFEVAVCMGDTVTHLQRLEDVWLLFERVYEHLEDKGILALTYRDLTSELKGTDRIVPVQSDKDKIMATFLEYEEYYVKVHDIIFVRRDSDWELKKSVYKKLRIGAHQITSFLQNLGFQIKISRVEKGFSSIVAEK